MVKHIQLLDPLIWIKDFNYQESWVVIILRYVPQTNPDNMLSEHVVMDPQFSSVSELYMVTFKFQLCAILVSVYIMQKVCL
jgi:hypothetical protein